MAISKKAIEDKIIQLNALKKCHKTGRHIHLDYMQPGNNKRCYGLYLTREGSSGREEIWFSDKRQLRVTGREMALYLDGRIAEAEQAEEEKNLLSMQLDNILAAAKTGKSSVAQNVNAYLTNIIIIAELARNALWKRWDE